MIYQFEQKISECDRVLARKAAHRASDFYDGVELNLEDDYLIITSDRHSRMQLQTIWKSLLVNERLTVSMAAHRTEILHELLQ
ncbi:hypothetical protein GCM10023219_20760 [Stakelama sediminis]|uniref:Uncharacterized protein n=1 Tax=Stakelama sediminis TaxID=463200 RepID=A0A840Z204_9SPHN|nr:hypothetical protein [Stakelama sediminis]MBB5719945.1 hypothetical protein [Stakelama sediminis]